MKANRLTILLLFLAVAGFSQNTGAPTGFWYLTSLSGEIKANGNYRELTRRSDQIRDNQYSSLLSGGAILNTSSYFWHPSFLTLDVNAEYSPEKNSDKYLVVPDQAEVRTSEKLDIRTTFFKKKAITIGTLFNYGESYSSRENLSNIRTNTNNWGVFMSYANKILPFSVNYTESKWKETELQTNRIFQTDQSILEAKFSKSFTRLDRHELTYSKTNFSRKTGEFGKVKNDADNVMLTDNIYFNKSRSINLNSSINGIQQNGVDSFKRFQAYENLMVKLPANFKLNGSYLYYYIDRKSQELTQNVVNGSLSHQLYQSLKSSVYAESNVINQSFYDENSTKTGVDFNYEKAIMGSRLNLAYNYYRMNQSHNSSDVFLQIISEEYTIKDGVRVLLKKPYVDLNSVVVKDVSGTIVYQLGFDYTLISFNNFVEIQRIPGGQILNNQKVYIDYITTQPGNYKYSTDNQYFSASLLLFKNKLELYYHLAKQDYLNLETADYLTLNYFTQNVYGGKIDFGFFNAGAEYDDYNSKIIPYRMMRYFAQLQGTINNKLIYALNANLRDYDILDEKVSQQYSDITGKLAYSLRPQTRLIWDLGYRYQKGPGLDLDLMTSRLELSTVFRQLYMTVGLEVYRRIYLKETVNFNGAYFQISRKF